MYLSHTISLTDLAAIVSKIKRLISFHLKFQIIGEHAIWSLHSFCKYETYKASVGLLLKLL